MSDVTEKESGKYRMVPGEHDIDIRLDFRGRIFQFPFSVLFCYGNSGVQPRDLLEQLSLRRLEEQDFVGSGVSIDEIVGSVNLKIVIREERIDLARIALAGHAGDHAEIRAEHAELPDIEGPRTFLRAGLFEQIDLSSRIQLRANGVIDVQLSYKGSIRSEE